MRWRLLTLPTIFCQMFSPSNSMFSSKWWCQTLWLMLHMLRIGRNLCRVTSSCDLARCDPWKCDSQSQQSDFMCSMTQKISWHKLFRNYKLEMFTTKTIGFETFLGRISRAPQISKLTGSYDDLEKGVFLSKHVIFRVLIPSCEDVVRLLCGNLQLKKVIPGSLL